MKNKKSKPLVFIALLLMIFSITAIGLSNKGLSSTKITQAKESEATNRNNETKQKKEKIKTGPMNLGKFFGQVTYNQEQDYYFLELRGARFPFKSSPINALDVPLDAPGKTDLKKNTSLLYGILGKEVLYTTLLVDPNEEDEVMPAAVDLQRYIQIANPKKFAGLAYTKEGGKLVKPIIKGTRIQAFKHATAKYPIILLKGPKSGAKQTKVTVAGDGKVVVEGKTYEELYKGVDRICITLIKMLCGSSDCPDAAACATGGNCGCG